MEANKNNTILYRSKHDYDELERWQKILK